MEKTKEMAIKRFAKDRDEAFTKFVHDDDFGHIEEWLKKYDMPAYAPDNKDVAKAGVYKAVQECIFIDEDTKELARRKCLELGFSPYMF